MKSDAGGCIGHGQSPLAGFSGVAPHPCGEPGVQFLNLETAGPGPFAPSARDNWSSGSACVAAVWASESEDGSPYSEIRDFTWSS